MHLRDVVPNVVEAGGAHGQEQDTELPTGDVVAREGEPVGLELGATAVHERERRGRGVTCHQVLDPPAPSRRVREAREDAPRAEAVELAEAIADQGRSRAIREHDGAVALHGEDGHRALSRECVPVEAQRPPEGRRLHGSQRARAKRRQASGNGPPRSRSAPFSSSTTNVNRPR